MKTSALLLLVSSLSTTCVSAFVAAEQSDLYAWAGSGYGFLTDQAKESAEVTVKRTRNRMRKPQGGSILDRLRDDDRFSKLMNLLKENKGLQDDLENMDKRVTFFAPTNEAFEKTKEMFEKHSGDGKNRRPHGPSMEEIVRYHMTDNELTCGDLYQGALIETRLKVDDLDDEYQKIKVDRFRDEPYLNMYVRIEEADIETENGVIHVVDRVLMPPPRVKSVLSLVATKSSTFLWALHRTGLDRDLDERSITVFAPSNDAWEMLGMQRLFHLFSDAGVEDLKRILQYHMSTDLVYTNEMINDKEIKLKTMLKDEKLDIKARRRSDECKEAWRAGGGHHKCDERRSPRNYLFSVNGEAQIVFEDAIAENGVIHAVGNVLIPRTVCLPTH